MLGIGLRSGSARPALLLESYWKLWLLSIACLCMLVFAAPQAHAAGRRIALLVGNSEYANEVGPLNNPERDITAVRETLVGIGFKAEDIVVVPNATRVQLNRAIDELANRAEGLGPSDVVFFYYSGHGAVRSGGRGMSLIPIDVKDASSSDLWYDTIALEDDVMRRFESAGSDAVWLLAIDACRNELKIPTRSLGGRDKGFGVISTASGMLVSFAADEGQTARDGYRGSSRSPYADALIEEVTKPGRTISSVFTAITGNVKRRTDGVQTPAVASKLTNDIVLVESPERPATDAADEIFPRKGLISEIELGVVDAIVSVFETGGAADYAFVSGNPSDAGGLSFGKHQAALTNGTLHDLIVEYCRHPDAAHCTALSPYLPQMKAGDRALDADDRLYSLLKRAASDRAMQESQDRFFADRYMRPALLKWREVGFKTPLSAAVIYDSYIHSGGLNLMARTVKSYGNPTTLNEREWIAGYVVTRKAWLEEHPNELLHRTAVRMRTFERLIESGNWDLKPPLSIVRPSGEYILTAYDLAAWLFQDPLRRLGTVNFGTAKEGSSAFRNGRDLFVQASLQVLGYLPADVVPDGRFSTATAAAVAKLQEALGLPVTGEVEGVTFDALCRELEKQSADPFGVVIPPAETPSALPIE
jgi:chitosanase